MDHIILASASPRRKELLTQIGAAFDIIPAKGEEIITGNTPGEAVMELALQKATEVARRISGSKERGSSTVKAEDTLIIGADTIVVYEGQILGKPKDEHDAVRMLTLLSGHTHSVYTGVALLAARNGKKEERTFYEETKVTVYPMSQEEIKAYVAAADPMDKAGSHMRDTEKPRYYWEGKAGGYGIQDPFGMRYIERIEGDYYNVVGLPVACIYQELKRMGLQIENKH